VLKKILENSNVKLEIRMSEDKSLNAITSNIFLVAMIEKKHGREP
jgi:hypothetical protein